MLHAGQGTWDALSPHLGEDAARGGCPQASWSVSESPWGFSNEKVSAFTLKTLPVFSACAWIMSGGM